MTSVDESREPRRRRATVRSLLVLIAVVGLGLAGIKPWWDLRMVHPEYAPITSLFNPSSSGFRCTACHGLPAIPAEIRTITVLENSPHGPGKMLECKSCHAR